MTWHAPDANGDGPEIWDERHDNEGRPLGRFKRVDNFNNVVHEYLTPAGFRNIPNSQYQASWTYCNDDGSIYRQPDGAAVVITPGHAVVFEPDGSVTYLTDEYAQHLFGLGHDVVSA